MGYSPGSVNESHYRVWYPTRWIRSMVLSRRNVFRMEIHWLALVDLWQAYVLQSISVSTPMTVHILSRLREEHPLVSRRLTLCPNETNLRCRVALQSSKTSRIYAKEGWGLLLTSISTSGTSISKIVETSFRLFSFNFPRSLVLVVISFIAFTWSMITVLKSPPKPH